jgi:hypothetical protein
MDWMSRFRASGKAEPADPADETVINGAPYDAQKEIRNSPRDSAALDDAKDRQIAAVVRYVTALRAR